MSGGASLSTRVEARTLSADDTRALARAFAGALEPGDVVLLVGDLGAGKTTFVQGLAAGLGVSEPVTSPTFTLVRPHACSGPEVRTLLHADLYRVERLHEVTDLALGEMVEDAAVAAVEWGDVGAPALGDGAVVVTLELGDAPGEDDLGDDQPRLIAISVPSSEPRWRALPGRLAPWVAGRS